MLGSIRIILIFSALACLGLCSSGFAHEIVNDSASSWLAPKTKQEIINSYDYGVAAGATHMLIVWDTWNFDESYDFIVYSYPGEDVNDHIKYYNTPGFYRVSAVFAMHLDISQQFSDKRWYPEYP